MALIRLFPAASGQSGSRATSGPSTPSVGIIQRPASGWTTQFQRSGPPGTPAGPSATGAGVPAGCLPVTKSNDFDKSRATSALLITADSNSRNTRTNTFDATVG